MEIGPLSLEDMETIIDWRHHTMESLRTPIYLTKEMQEQYYENVICDRHSTTRYFKFAEGGQFIAMGGIENIQFENHLGEISLLINPDLRKKGNGTKCVDLILDRAFNYIGLKYVWGECYECNPVGVSFWKKMCKKYNAFSTNTTCRKYYQGKQWDSLWFCIEKSKYLS